LLALGPAFGAIDEQLSQLSDFRDKPAGKFRITAGQHAIDTILWPRLSPQELAAHRCINLRLPSYGGFYAWEFAREGQEVRVRVEGQVAFNGVPQLIRAALDGFGLAYIHEDVVRKYLDDSRLIQVLADWTPPFPGYHLYYPSRRHPSPAFTLLVDALRHHE